MTTVKTLRTTHPVYDALKLRWDFYLTSYEGGPDYITSGNLFSHVREDPGDYADRLRRAYYLNYCRAIIDTYVSHLSRKPVTRKTSSPALLQFVADCTGLHQSLDRFMFERIAPLVQVLGTVYILVDMPRLDDAPLTRHDEQSRRLRPYCVPVFPQDVINWSVDESGDFNWFRIRERITEGNDPFEAKPAAQTFYRTWTRDCWWLHNDRGELVAGGPEQGRHNLGIVPIVKCINVTSRLYPGMGLSSLTDIAPINREIFNLSSLLQEFLARQCFNFLVLDEDLLSDEGRRRLGSSNALPGRHGAVLPHYVSPPVDPARFLQTERETAIQEIYRLALLPPGEVLRRRTPSSGLARAYDFHDANQSLARKAAVLESCERSIMDLVVAWLGLDESIEIDYPRDFSVTDLADEMNRALQAVSLDISPTFNRELKKNLHRRLLPGSKQAGRIDDEIDGRIKN